MEPSAFIAQYSYAGIFLLLVLGGVGLPFPEDVTLILSGGLVAQGVMSPAPAFMTVYFGLLTSDFIVYSIGRRWGARLVRHRRFRRILSPEKLLKLEGLFARRGIIILLFGRLIYGVRSQIFLVAGTMGMPRKRFLAADAVAALMSISLMMGAIGYMGGRWIKAIPGGIKGLGFIVLVVAVLVFVMRRSYGRLHKKKGDA